MDKNKLDPGIQNILSVYEYAKDKWKPSIDLAKTCYEFVLNKQWNDEEIDIYLKRQQPPMVYNMILPRINNLIGTEQLNRRSAKIKPFSAGNQPLADLLNGLLRNIMETAGGEDELRRTFADGIITPLPGCLQVNVEPDTYGYMEYAFRALNPLSVTFDPEHSRYDLSDCNYIITERFLRLDEIIDLYGEKGDLTLKGYEKKWWTKLSETLTSISGSMFGFHDPDVDYVDSNNNTYKVMEMQNRYTEKREMFADVETGEFIVVPKEAAKEFAEQAGDKAQYVGQTDLKKIHLTAICPYFNAVLLDEPSWLDTPMYNIIPYYSFNFNNVKRNNSSLVAALLDPQRNLNKREIQKTDYIDRAMVSPVVFSYDDRDAKEEYDERGNTPMSSLMVRNMRYPIYRLQPSPIGGDAWNDIADSENKMNDISGINDTARGQSEYSNESGRLFEMKAQRVGATINPYLNNLSLTRKMLGQYFLSTVKQVYSEMNRVISIMDERGNTEEMAINIRADLGTYNDITSFEGRVVVDDADYSPNKLQETMQTKLALAQIMPPELVNWAWILKDSELPDVQEQIDYTNMVLGIQSQNAERERAMAEDQYATQVAMQEEQARAAAQKPEKKEEKNAKK